ncbi:GlxA family transcriptional regulator [Pelomonas sp. V22]|uniref:GlxA family transcriptional regulator n=1 Tax=Pelomonas sp. V22 TaxID=2822139 RepID=UPI0024A84E6B|nr:GlxA family transcriptional regulator [Pelomonas sp. V22]MDI4634078.1 GlxA family transcriptional regulator [Pelomonas sp. V22]
MLQRRCAFLLLPGFGLGSLAGATEALSAVNGLLEGERYESLLLGLERSVTSACGLSFNCQLAGEQGEQRLDALFIVAEGLPPAPEASQAALLHWLRGCGRQGLVLGGIGSGAAWLAEAGLLNGYRATLNWPHIPLLAERHPEVLFSQHLFEIDRDRLSCAAHSASQDLLIHWLGQRHGERLAQELAASLGLERLRSREEHQRQPLAGRLGLAGSAGTSAKLAEALALMEANLGEPLSTEEISGLVGVSRRQLERLFKQHLDAVPARWYLSLRLERARRMLRQTSQSVLQIGLSCGFASASHFSNAYKACYGCTPRDERSRHGAQWRATSPDKEGTHD